MLAARVDRAHVWGGWRGCGRWPKAGRPMPLRITSPRWAGSGLRCHSAQGPGSGGGLVRGSAESPRSALPGPYSACAPCPV
eukprot:5016895-Prymnesium_polylepis.1